MNNDDKLSGDPDWDTIKECLQRRRKGDGIRLDDAKVFAENVQRATQGLLHSKSIRKNIRRHGDCLLLIELDESVFQRMEKCRSDTGQTLLPTGLFDPKNISSCPGNTQFQMNWRRKMFPFPKYILCWVSFPVEGDRGFNSFYSWPIPERVRPGIVALACSAQGCPKNGSQHKLKKCSRCGKDYYCSRECQHKDWSRHKKHCFSKYKE